MPAARVQEVSNTDLFLFALYELGGAERQVDIEDVFLKMYEIAPDRFGWRKHQLPNYKSLHTAMGDAERPGKNLSGTLIGEAHLRQLSGKGIGYVEGRLPVFRAIAGGTVQAPPDKRPLQRAAVAVEKSPVFQRFQTGSRTPLRRHELAMLMRCTPDSPQGVWRSRLESLRAAATAARRDDLLDFLSWLETSNTDVFGGSE